MKKSVVIIVVMLIITITACMVVISINNKKILAQKQSNKDYEQYTNKSIYGTEVITLINKAMDNNKKNNVIQDAKGYFIENDNNSIIVELIMITNEEKEKTKVYRMETISKGGIEEFISNFNTAKFKITELKYHEKTKKIKYIQISQEYE